MIQFNASKQIDFVGLERTGLTWYRCKYPVLLAAWLREQGFREVPKKTGEIARLAGSQTQILVRKSGSVHVLGKEQSEVHDTLRMLIRA